jgi:hypothetical protein
VLRPKSRPGGEGAHSKGGFRVSSNYALPPLVGAHGVGRSPQIEAAYTLFRAFIMAGDWGPHPARSSLR